MAEMHAMIARRSGVPAAATIPSPIHSRARSMSEVPQSPPKDSMSRSIKSLEEMVGEVEGTLARAMHNSDKCMEDVQQLLETSQSVSYSSPPSFTQLLTPRSRTPPNSRHSELRTAISECNSK
jgi:hypothetical protein